MANIPSEVIQLHILLRLPVKSLIRFKSVSKSWQTCITSPDFIRLHRQHDKNRFLVMLDKTSHTLHRHELDSPSTAPLVLTYAKPATCTTPMVVVIVAACETALLLCYSTRSNRHDINLRRTQTHEIDEFVLLNPSTESYHKIPRPSIQSNLNYHYSIYGLYLDEANDEYKVAIIINQQYPPTQREVMVYSSKTNSWTLIEQKVDIYYRIAADVVAVIGHLLHTIFDSMNTEKTTRIGCFDIVAEQWTNGVPLLDRFDDYGKYCNRLCVFDGLLCVGVQNGFFSRCNYQVWVMKDYGVEESWVCLLNIDDTSITCGFGYLPVTYCERSRHKILCRTSYNDRQDPVSPPKYLSP